MRKKLIGCNVKVEIEYERATQYMTKDGEQEGKLVFATIWEGKENVGVTLVKRGLAEAIELRGNEKCSSYIKEITDAQELAQKN